MFLTILFPSLLASAGLAQSLSNSDFRDSISSTTVLSRSSNLHGTNSSILNSTESSPVYSTTASPSTPSSSRISSTSSSSSNRPSIVVRKTSPTHSSSFIFSTTSSQRSSSRLGTRPSPHSNASSTSTTSSSKIKDSTTSSSSSTSSKSSPKTTTRSSLSPPSSRAAPTKNSIDLVSQASSIISRHDYRSFCSACLGYTANHSTVSITSTVRASTVVTAYPTDDTTTKYTEYTSTYSSTVPAATENTTTTPFTTVYYTITQTHTTTQANTTSSDGFHREKQIPTSRTSLSTPGPLKTYPPDILSSACSENIAKPSSTSDITTTLLSTKMQTSYNIKPYTTTTSTIISRTTQTITQGTSTSTSTFDEIEIDSFTFTTATTTVTNCLSPTLAACPIPLLGTSNNRGISYLAALDASTTGTLLPNITSACACAQACRSQNNCAGSYFANGACGYVSVASCEPGTVVAIYGEGGGEEAPCEGWVVGNGTCGGWGYGGA